ncbi:MAG: DUF4412 domain-containing protein [Bacteroidales bacterium]|nr:DUF4412 domain-containing protein [Bacteroidales bacterium]MCF8405991.1 DUF4412 domain-containing protein [Bacteroidales bacterium]
MKKITKAAFFVTLLVFLCATSYAGGKGFSGVITYKITFDNPDLDAQTLAMMPKTLTVKIKGDKLRTEISFGMGKTVVIYNGEENNGATLMDIMGQKYAIKMTTEEIDKELAEAPKVEVVLESETKDIAGYSCKKALVKPIDKSKADNPDIVVYYSDDLGSGQLNKINPMYKDIDGVLMEYIMEENNMKMKFEALKVEKKKLGDDEFEIPEGYNIVTESEFETMFGGF